MKEKVINTIIKNNNIAIGIYILINKSTCLTERKAIIVIIKNIAKIISNVLSFKNSLIFI